MDKIVGFEHCHRHTHFSTLDGFATLDEYGELSKQINQKYLCITDHGSLGAIPQQIKAGDEYDLNCIFGCELYLNPMQPEIKPGDDNANYTKDFDPIQRKRFRKSYHLLAIAYNDTGYKNLVNLSSWAWTRGFYGKPRVNHEQLLKHKEGIIFTSCCYNGEIGQAFDGFCSEEKGDEPAFRMLEKYMAMFGENFYLELMLLDFKKQKPFDAFLLRAHEKYGIPLLLSQDCHYARKEDSHMQRLMLMINTKRTLQEVTKLAAEEEGADLFELQDTNLWMKSEEEINEKWEKDYQDTIDFELLTQAKKNTVLICEKAKGVQIDRSIKLPKIDNENERLLEETLKGFNFRRLPKNKAYEERLKEEYQLICRKGFASYFLIQKMMVDEARRVAPSLMGFGDGFDACGPGRGSAGGSLICYCLGITQLDPIKHDLLFSRFLSPSRGGKQTKLRFTIDPIKIDEPVESFKEYVKAVDKEVPDVA